MKSLISLAVFIFIYSIVWGQDLKGQWNGVLNAQGSELKLVFHVSKPATGYQTTVDSPDQNAKDMVVTKTTYSFPKVKFEVSSIGGVFEGVMGNDKSTITGKWIQSGLILPLVLVKDKNP